MRLSQQFFEFLENRKLSCPTGRPLYSYRCTAREFEELRVVLQGELPPTIGYQNHFWRALFCLYVAEWWNRNHTGGPWKWGHALESVGAAVLAPGEAGYVYLGEVVVKGLKVWRRNVLTSSCRNLYLFTLACEGGLPMGMVGDTTRQSSLRTYFRKILEVIDRGSEEQFREYTELFASHLPRSLRQDVVYELSTKLLMEVHRLAQIIDNDSDPVEWLDSNHPDWKNALPLRLTENTARSFMRALLGHAVAVQRNYGTRIQWRRNLRRYGRGWVLEGGWALPRRVTEPQMRELFADLFKADLGTPHGPSHCELGSESPDGDYVGLAIGMRVERDGATVFDLDPKQGYALVTRGVGAARGRALVVRTGSIKAIACGAEGTTELGPGPWVFEDEDSEGVARYFGEGVSKIGRSSILVACTADALWEPGEGASVEECGRLEGMGRIVYRVSGSALLLCTLGNDPEELVEIRFRTGAGGVITGGSYSLTGPILRGTVGKATIYEGVPKLRWYPSDPEQPPRTIEATDIRWRPQHQDTRSWCRDPSSCLGDVILRYSVDGVPVYQGKMCVAPRHATIITRPSASEVGSVELRNWQASTVTAHAALDSSTEMSARLANGTATVSVPSNTDPQQLISIDCQWPALSIAGSSKTPSVFRRRAKLQVTPPVLSAQFRASDGRAIPWDSTLTLEQLAMVRADVFLPGHHADTFVEASYRGSSNVPTEWLRWRIEIDPETGKGELELYAVQSRLEAVLNSSETLDGEFVLRILVNGVTFPQRSRIVCRRFDSTIVFDRARDILYLGPERPWRDLDPERLQVNVGCLSRAEKDLVEVEWDGGMGWSLARTIHDSELTGQESA